MDGCAKSEPALGGACCTGPDHYRPIGKFQVGNRQNTGPNVQRAPIAGHGLPRSLEMKLVPFPSLAVPPCSRSVISDIRSRTGRMPISGRILTPAYGYTDAVTRQAGPGQTGSSPISAAARRSAVRLAVRPVNLSAGPERRTLRSVV